MPDNSIKKTTKIGEKEKSLVIGGTFETGRFSGKTPNKANEPKTALEPRADLERGTVMRSPARRDKAPLPVCTAPSKGRSASVYFNNGSHLAYLAEVQKLHPRASISSIMCQLLAAFCEAAEGEVTNVVTLDSVEIKL